MQNKVQNLKIVTAFMVVFIVLLAAAACINLVKVSRINARERQLTAELARLETEYAAGEDEIALKQTREYIIRQARDYYNMKGKDETAFSGKE